MKHRVGIRIKILISLLAIFLMSMSIVFFTKMIEKEMRTQLHQSMKDVADQNVTALRNQIRSNELLLDGVISEIENTDNRSEAVLKYQNFVEQYGLKRLGYCQPDGMTISTDGAIVDLSHRGFFQRGMEGKATISGVLIDAMSDDGGQVCVISKPMYEEDGDICGVGCITYDLSSLNDVLRIDCFDGQGYSFAVNETGEVMVRMGNDQIELSENLFEVISDNPENEAILRELEEGMNSEETISGIIELFDQEYFYATPVKLMGGEVTWYMITMVPKGYYDYHFDIVRNNLYRMDAVVIIVLLVGIMLILHISEKQREESLQFAYTDPVTHGPNYAKLCQVVDGMRGKKGVLISIDIRNFRNVNIAGGRNAGDRMIVEIWKVIENSMRQNEAAARVREDEFGLYIDTRNRDSVVERIEKMAEQIHALAKKIQVPNVFSNYGIYEIREGETADDAFVKARLARDELGGDREKYFAFYDEISQEKLWEDQKLEERFEEAVETEEFVVWYQPKYSVKSKEIVGSEALVRWRDKDGTLISPGRFIPLFEKNGLISHLDEYMFRNVCKQQAKWLEEGHQILPVSVNLSRATMYHEDIVERYCAILEEYHLDSKYVQIEVTETVMEGRIDIIQMLGKFRSLGIRVLMDDFGTGYSSLATLGMSCFDTLKLDKSLIDHIGEEKGEMLLSHVISMGQKLGLHITAEGVENSMQFDFLQKVNCDDIQGFLFAKPMPSEDFEKLLKN